MVALDLFLSRFPVYRKNEIYFTGHGYGAVFMSYMAHAIVEANKDPYSIYVNRFNLKGIMMGNPCVQPQ